MRPKPMSLLDHREFPVLYVDDEPENLRIFELTFKRKFSILTAQSAEEGLRVLNENPVAVVLSDHRMPGMTGVEFLSRVRSLDENTIRILVTAYGDASTLGVAINDGAIYRYVPKPWEPEDMRLTLRRAIEAYALDRERDALLRELTQLNTLSRALYSELDVDNLHELLLQTAHSELGFDGATLLLFDREGDRLDWKGFAPATGEVAERLAQIEVSRDSARTFIEAARRGETQTLSEDQVADLDPAMREWVQEVCAEEIVAVPLVGKESVIGVLAVDNRAGGKRFGADERTLLDGLAIQAVIALENATLVRDLKRSREQVLRADRLGTLGTLAAGLAHEINNPLVSIHTFLSLAPEKRAENDPEFWQQYHQLAANELERIRGLVATMSKLGKGGGPEVDDWQPVDLKDLASEVVTLLQREAHAAQVTLELESDDRTPKVQAARDRLHQVFLNLILNAIHATPVGGRVRMTVSPDPEQSDGACICLEDSGQGIPEENLERIFDPFFTTKDPDKGTGLGLMISHQIVADHGGAIEVRSRPEEGTTFRVRLPASGPRRS